MRGFARRALLGLDAPEVKAQFNLSSDLDRADLSVLSLDELKAYEAIQNKLAQSLLDSKEKARLNEGGYFASAHEVSTLLSQLRSGAFDQIEVTH